MVTRIGGQWLSGLNLQYAVRLDYDRDLHEDEDDDGYHRNSTIEGAHVTEANVVSIREDLLRSRRLSEVEQYCIERILVAHKVYDPENWEVWCERGYYGEEIGGAKVVDKVAAAVDADIRTMIELKTDTEKVEFVLKLEYGYLLDVLEGKRYKVVNVKRKELVYQQEHYHKLDQKVVKMYSADYKLPRGVVVRKDDRYRLIDGYHRVVAAPGDYLKLLVAS